MVKKKHKHPVHQGIKLSQKAQSKLAKQRKQQKLTRWIGLGVIGAVVLILSVGWVTQWLLPVYIPLQKTVLTVNGTDYSAGYVSKMVNFYNGDNAANALFFIDFVMGQIEEMELMKQAAAEMGITVSDQEVKDRLKETELEDNAVSRDIVRASLLAQKINDEYIDGLVPTSADQRHSLVMLLESAAQAEEVKARLEAGEAFADIVTELSLDSTTITEKGDMGFNPIGIIDGQLFAEGLDTAVNAAGEGEIGFFYDENKSKQLGYWVVKVTERQTENEAQKVHVFGMLLPTIEKAEEARQRVIDGEDFETVAKEVSQDATSKESGGDLGLLTLGQNTPPFATYIFDENTPLNDLSAPILTKDSNTTGAWWLYQIAAVEENRTIDEEDRDTLLNQAFSDWLEEVKADPANVIETVELTLEQRDLIATQSLN
ncbi:peptidylprolyl isomerase [Dehalogenimonas sp. THU2]|uniref:peptidylprolyl isomerase n=1 Tax=Dehalogenimonas sp. THU2 TaxID=3151121 RepID=UPI003218AEEA